jgi:hypothetical protein
VPRTTFTLDASADHFRFSQPLGQLAAGQAFDLFLSIAQINHADTEAFAHSVDFWLSPEASPSASTATTIGFAWSAGSQWVVGYRSPSTGFSYTTIRPTIATGTQHAVRIARAIDGSVQLWLDGVNVWSVGDADSSPTLFAQVVGLRVDFAY